jgi:Holliday junction DNA helicase RuvB
MVTSRATEKIGFILTRHPESYEYLERVYSKWMEYKSKAKCYTCGSTNLKWVDDFTYECDNGHSDKLLGLESWEFGVPPWFMKVLHDQGLVAVLYKSRSSTHYGVYEETLRAIEDVLSRGYIEELSEPPLPEPSIEMFKDIVGLDDVKRLIVDVLKSDKPVHLLIVGPPASAKTMMLEAISRLYDVPIILSGTSTRAGLRDFIIENKPTIMIIDELDKIENPLDLSVLLTWMESQKLIVTMATRKTVVKCPNVCKVIAAANKTDRIPPELLSRFIVVRLRQYTDEEAKKVCINVAINREGVEEGLAKLIADAVVDKLNSRDPRDCIKLARLAKTPDDVERIVKILSKR